MTQSQEQGHTPREMLVNEVGERIGMWAGRALQRLQRAAGALNEEADHIDADVPDAEAHAQSATADRPHHAEGLTMERAEELVDRVGATVIHWTAERNIRMRQALARLREDMEDLWIEAHEQQKHQHQHQQEETHKEMH